MLHTEEVEDEDQPELPRSVAIAGLSLAIVVPKQASGDARLALEQPCPPLPRETVSSWSSAYRPWRVCDVDEVVAEMLMLYLLFQAKSFVHGNSAIRLPSG